MTSTLFSRFAKRFEKYFNLSCWEAHVQINNKETRSISVDEDLASLLLTWNKYSYMVILLSVNILHKSQGTNRLTQLTVFVGKYLFKISTKIL